MNEIVSAAVSSNGDTAVIIDASSCETLKKMFKSDDPADHLVGQMILTKCDVGKSIYSIWKISKDVYVNRMVNLRTKAGRKFRDDSNLFSLANYSTEGFISFITGKNWLTNEIFTELEPELRKKVTYVSRNTYYNVTLELKDEYKNYMNNE